MYRMQVLKALASVSFVHISVKFVRHIQLDRQISQSDRKHRR